MSSQFLTRRALFTAAAVAGALSVAGCTSSLNSTPTSGTNSTGEGDHALTLGLTYIPNVQFAPAYLAEDKGYFKNHGVAVKVRHHGADEGLFTQLLAGKENLVVATGDEMIQARAEGMDLISVARYYATYPVVIIVKDGSPIRTIGDLKGKRVGLPGKFGSNWFGFLAALKDSGMTEADVQVKAIGYTQIAALQADQVDAIVGFANNDAIQLEQAGVKIRQIALTKSGSVPLVGANVVTTGAYLHSHQTEVKQTLAALKEGMQAFISDPAAAVAATQKRDPAMSEEKARKSAQATAEATAKLLAPDGKVDLTQDLKAWEDMNNFLSSIPGLMGAQVSLPETVTNDYVK